MSVKANFAPTAGKRGLCFSELIPGTVYRSDTPGWRDCLYFVTSSLSNTIFFIGKDNKYLSIVSDMHKKDSIRFYEVPGDTITIGV